jgi:hypothetical protein
MYLGARIGVVALLLVTGLTLGWGPAPSPVHAQGCSISFALNPASGTANPGGTAQFTVTGQSTVFCQPLVFRPSFQATANFSMAFNPPQVLIPPGGQGVSHATVQLAPSTPAGIYELRVRVEVFTTEGQPVGVRELIFTLRVTGTGNQAGPLTAALAIDRGCGASYRIGEPLVISFQVSQDAIVTLRLRMPDGSGRVLLANQPVRGGVTNTLQGTVSEPPGSRLLILEAMAGEQHGRAECAFTAVRDAATELKAQITTDQGCLEKGQEPVYYLEEPIVVSFRVDGVEQALVRILDMTIEGTRLLLQQTVPGNRDLSFTGVATLPLGLDTLLLQVFIGSVVATEARCSFFVQNEPKPDLHTTEVDAPKEAEEGAEITVKNTVKNSVTRGIRGGDAGKFRVGIYFSKDKDFSADDDRLLGSRDVAGLKRDKSSNADTKITLPKDLVPEGSDSLDGFILVVADDQKEVDEQNEENNVKSAKDKAKAVKLTAAPAEIAVAPDKAEFTIHVGTSKEETFTITNMGKKTLEIKEPSAKAPFTAQIDKRELKPKETATLTVRFSPNQVGKVKEVDAKVTINSNAKNKPVLEIPIPAEATNTAPTIELSPRSGDGVYAVATGKTLKITAQASDPDTHKGRETGEKDNVTVKVVGPLPEGAGFDGNVLTFATKEEQAGKDFEITFEAEDEHGTKTQQKITVKVRKPNPIPWNPQWDANYPNIPVTWDDFLGDVPANAPADRDAETSYVPPQGGVGAHTSFLRDSSWVRPGARDSALLLEHERGHFAIAEIFVRRYNAAADDAGRRAVIAEHNRIQALYDDQTLPSGEGKRACQQAWSGEIQRALTGQAGAMPATWGGPAVC